VNATALIDMDSAPRAARAATKKRRTSVVQQSSQGESPYVNKTILAPEDKVGKERGRECLSLMILSGTVFVRFVFSVFLSHFADIRRQNSIVSLMVYYPRNNLKEFINIKSILKRF